MFVFGHLGIGSALARPVSRGLPKRYLLLGTVLPDIIDKTLFYGLSVVSGTRTFGHTALFLFTLCMIAFIRQSRLFAALALGIATHLVLDGIWDRLGPRPVGVPLGGVSSLAGLFWPFLGTQFPLYPFSDIKDHLSKLLHPTFWGGELIGIALLSLEFWRSRYPTEYRTKPPR